MNYHQKLATVIEALRKINPAISAADALSTARVWVASND